MRSWHPPFWIGDRLFTVEDLVFIKRMVREFGKLSRTELAATVCENLPWKAPNGKIRVNGCRLLLEEMADAGLIVLPPKKLGGDRKSYCHTKVPPVLTTEIKCSLSRLSPVTVDVVPNSELAVWNSTMAAYHPMGFRQPFGAHQRYWIRSEGKANTIVLGAMLFAAPAKALADRDAWIGWTTLQRQRFRYRIVSNSRFLILPGIQVPHLASHVLGLAVRRLRKDWVERYGYAPVLVETFVTSPHKGTCYRAANWRFVGETASNGRSCRIKRSHAPIRTIFVYPLVRNWRAELCAPELSVDEESDADAVIDFT